MTTVPVPVIAARRITNQLIAAGALAPERAQPIDVPFPGRRLAIDRLLHAGVLNEAGSERYWIDALALERWHAARLRRVLAVMLVLGLLFALLALGGIFRR